MRLEPSDKQDGWFSIVAESKGDGKFLFLLGAYIISREEYIPHRENLMPEIIPFLFYQDVEEMVYNPAVFGEARFLQ